MTLTTTRATCSPSPLIDQVLGTTRQFLGQTLNDTLAAGQTKLYAFVLTSTELATVASGSVTLGVEVDGQGGFNPGTIQVLSTAADQSSVTAGRSVALFTFTAPGVYTIAVSGATSADAGNYSAQVYLAGDLNGDDTVDGTDEALFAQALGIEPGASPITRSRPTSTATASSTCRTRFISTATSASRPSSRQR